MKVQPVNNSQIYNQKQSPSFGRFKVIDNADGAKVLKVIQKRFPTMGSERIGSSFLFRTKMDLEVETRHYKFLSTQELQKHYDGFLTRNAPVLHFEHIETLSDSELDALVNTTDNKFQMFVNVNNLFQPVAKHIQLPADFGDSSK